MPRISAAQRRQDFVRAAVEVIATHGIDGATTRRIAEQAKANLAMVHYCYDSKEDLFADVYEFVVGKFRDLTAAVDPQATVEQTAHKMLRDTMEYYVESPSFAVSALELINWARRQHGSRGIELFDKALEGVRATLRAAAGERPIDDETIDAIASAIAFVADGFAVSWITYGDRALAEKQMEIADSLLDSWLTARLGATNQRATKRRRTAASR
ncbi:TetR/AcrR family transcriptional regulator [Amycolatopsis sp. SID8362]|uniref:TetR/AcrR family transcriptional regulator n=1 Tax=Amycolatopsis sp. SID8362 TaxID=2690346 RepID=UPI00136BD574|nr:TetR/AcrR family transcriptional regulator [Amycolatopsis sp. SID8362]NBH12060.1 TetR family transcriptional regulator [Amycolatopsis sp. SID8362]NED48751.1 TetR family transcriptional regulator [Amycolatopsis sp. SID8362]